MNNDNNSYGDAMYPIPVLSIEFITMTLGLHTDDNSFDTMLQSLITDSNTDIYGNERQIPKNGNQDGPFWRGDSQTPITYILRCSNRNRGYNLHGRIARLVSVLYLKCGIPVTGRGAAFVNPLTICVTNGNVQAATALLRDTEACIVESSIQRLLLKTMVESGQTKMLKLFAKYKSRTFPNADEYLNGFEGSESKYIPLFYAAVSMNDPDLVRVLIYGFGANPDIIDHRKRKAIDLIRDTDPDPNVGYGRRLDEERVKRQKIIGLLDAEAMHIAFSMSQHPRLGSNSLVQSLPMETMDRIRVLTRQPD